MKTLLALLITMSFAFNSQAFAQSESELTAKMSSMLDEADKMGGSDFRFKQLITINVLETLAKSNIDDPELIERVINNVETLKSTFSNAQMRMVEASRRELNKR